MNQTALNQTTHCILASARRGWRAVDGNSDVLGLLGSEICEFFDGQLGERQSVTLDKRYALKGRS